MGIPLVDVTAAVDAQFWSLVRATNSPTVDSKPAHVSRRIPYKWIEQTTTFGAEQALVETSVDKRPTWR